MSSLAEQYPKAQAHLRTVLENYRTLDGMPQVNVRPAIFMLTDLQSRAEEAAAAGDVVAMLTCYGEMMEAQ